MKLTVKANAKINLLLDVTGIKKNGYHSLFTVMQSISLGDMVTVEKTNGNDITISCTVPGVPTDSRNIVYKCADKFFQYAGITENKGVHIHIDKVTPFCAGMGGGSADGAAVLVALNKIFNTNYPEKILCRIGVKVGADIPFCIVGGTCVCEGIGEILTPVAIPSPNYYVLISFPGEGISTPIAYKMLDEIERPGEHSSAEDVIEALKQKEIPKNLYNAFEFAVLPTHENARLVKKTMLDTGAISAMMSGSGSTIFGLFDSEASISACRTNLAKLGFSSHTCTPTN